MATDYQLSYRPRERRWRKRCRGKDYYFPLQDGETKASSYQRVLREWRKLKATIDGDDAASHSAEVRDAWRPVLTAVRESQQLLINKYGDTDETRRVWQELERRFVRGIILSAMDRGEKPSGRDIDVIAGLVESDADAFEGAFWQPTLEFLDSADGEPQLASGKPPWLEEPEIDTTLHGLADAFAASVRSGASLRHADNVKRDVDAFLATLAGDTTVDQAFASATLGQYLQTVRSLQLMTPTKANKIASVKQFAMWLYEHDHLESIPRLIARKKFKIEVETVEVEIFEDTDIAAILKASVDKARLYILLALNCGFTQVEIGDLRHTDLDLQGGTITRRRSKTGKHKRVPTVTWKLWPETLRLLSRHISEDPDRVLMNSQGRPLVAVREDAGKTKRTDAIAKTMARLRDKMGRKKPISFSDFRPTAASKLAEQHPEFSQLFLCHAPATVAEKHYVRPSQEQFDKAVMWLRDAFGIAETCQ